MGAGGAVANFDLNLDMDDLGYLDFFLSEANEPKETISPPLFQNCILNIQNFNINIIRKWASYPFQDWSIDTRVSYGKPEAFNKVNVILFRS